MADTSTNADTMSKQFFCLLSAVTILLSSCSPSQSSVQSPTKPTTMSTPESTPVTTGLDSITIGGGCFWCVEAVYAELKGVISAKSGYSGGKIKNPAYKEVCAGTTGHAEVVQVVYDPAIVPLELILEVFFTVHDPTTLNRQGADVGTQYRSVIYYHNEAQKLAAEKIIAKLSAEAIYSDPIVTEVSPFTQFYLAEDYHQDFYSGNQDYPYCRIVIQPKIEKFRKVFDDYRKK